MMRSLQPEHLSSFIVVKSRQHRRRGSKKPNLPELPPKAQNENKPEITSHTQPSHLLTPLLQQSSNAEPRKKTRPIVTISKRSPTQSHPLEESPVFTAALDSLNFSPPHIETFSSTTRPNYDHDAEKASNSLNSNVVHRTDMPRGGRRGGFSPATPTHMSGNSGLSRMPRSRPSPSTTMESDNSRENLAPVSWAHKSSLNPAQQPFKPRMPPQDARLTMGDNTPPSHGRMQRQRSAQKQGLADPFYEQRPASTRFSDAVTSHNSPNVHQQSAYGVYGNELVPYQPPMRSQNPYYQHDAYAQQPQYHQYPAHDASAHAQQPQYRQYSTHSESAHTGQPQHHQSSAHDESAHAEQSHYHEYPAYESAHAQTTRTQQPLLENDDPFNQQQASFEQTRIRPRPAVRMPPPAVKGTPTYDHRLALLQSLSNDEEMRIFYNSNPQYREQLLDYRFGPQQTLTTNTLSPSKNLPQELIAHAHARRGSEQLGATTSPIRDPAPYTGFRAQERKKDQLLQSLGEVLETSKGQNNLAGASRTVLHDPVAHASAKKAAEEMTEPTIKVSAPRLQFATTVKQPDTTTDLVLYQPQPQKETTLSNTSPANSAFGPNDFHLLPNISIPPMYGGSTIGQTVQPKIAGLEHNDPKNYNPFAGIGELVEGSFTASPKRSRFFPAPKATKYTATGFPIPHGGFADFTTPYGVRFFGRPQDFTPTNDIGKAPGNTMINDQAHVPTKSKDDNLREGVEWFHSADRYRDLHLVAQDLAFRADVMHARGGSHQAQTPTTSYTTPQAKPLPKPIGHERSSASKSSGGKDSILTPTTTNSNRTDLMKNPSAADTSDLMAGVLANLMRYADGTAVGDSFARWGRPSEWAIDNTKDGNKSFFGGGFEAAPLRVARDPRYQQTMTSDGRPTYFEDPGKGKGRAWGM